MLHLFTFTHMLKAIIFVFLGGGLGSIFRFIIQSFTPKLLSTSFPIATFSINVIGSLLIGLFIGYLSKNGLDNSNWKLLLVTGFCGGFTTFSSFSQENIQLIRDGQITLAFTYCILSIIVGISATALGYSIAK